MKILQSKLSILWIALTFMLGCETALAKPLRFIYLQGYLSCTLSNQVPVRKFLEMARNHPEAKMYWGCFDAGLLQHARDARERFYLHTLESNGEWSSAQELNAHSAPLEMALMLKQETNELIDSRVEESNEPAMDVFIAGHSHGGWMAMRLAYQLAGNEHIAIQRLLTIDPISYNLCSSNWFPAHALKNTFRWWGEPHDCHRAPRDLEHLEDRIAAGTNGQWVNIYQESMAYVSSGPIKRATWNLSYRAKTKFDWFTAHRAALLDQSTWTTFYRHFNTFIDALPGTSAN